MTILVSFTVRQFNLTTPAPPTHASWSDASLEMPLDLEIGCGVGWHPIQYAAKYPDRRLIAIEHTRTKFARFQSRLDRHQHLDNLRAVHADAMAWVHHHLMNESVEKCFLLYPNPEPKAPNKRWMRSPFMHRLLEVLKSGGELTLATNEERYFTEAREWAKNSWHLDEIEVRSLTKSTHPEFRTHFEKKYLLRGETCFDVRFRKK